MPVSETEQFDIVGGTTTHRPSRTIPRVCGVVKHDELYRDAYDGINQYDEWGVGVELLIDQIRELKVKILGGQNRWSPQRHPPATERCTSSTSVAWWKLFE
jgi:hypothetical protein